MAKVGFWLRGAKGKLAGSALQKTADGDTMAREIVKPHNPRTSNQTLQRVLVNTVAQGYKALKPIAYHAFEGKTGRSQNMRVFMKENLNYFRLRATEVGAENLGSYINFVPVGQTGVRPAAFIISQGSLPSVDAVSINSTFQAVLALSANTYQAVLDDYDLKRGDQLTFCTIDKNVQGQFIFHYSRVILDPRNSDGSPAPLSSDFISEGTINLPNSKNEGNFGTLQFGVGGLTFTLKANVVTCCVAIIASRKDSSTGEWLRSNAQFIVSEEAVAASSISMRRAIDMSYSKASIYLTDESDYLNNAGVGGSQSTDSGSSDTDTAPVFSNSIQFSANGSTFANSVSGGSVELTTPLTRMVVSGSNLTAGMLKAVKGDGTEIGAFTGSGSYLTWQGNAVVADSPITVKKVLVGGEVAWFNVRIIEQNSDGGGGSGLE